MPKSRLSARRIASCGAAVIFALACAAGSAQESRPAPDAPLGVGGIGGQAATPIGPGQSGNVDQRLFNAADLNGDAALTGKETREYPEYFDGDADGRITFAEFAASRREQQRLLAAAAKSRAAEQQFRLRDLTEDGLLSGTEKRGVESRDLNGDGAISLDEFAANASPSPRPTLGSGPLGGPLGGGVPAADSIPAQPLARFMQLDENEDGRLSGTEMKGLENLDVDGNGRVTRDEFPAGSPAVTNSGEESPAQSFGKGKLLVALFGVSGYGERMLASATPGIRRFEQSLVDALPDGKLGGQILADDDRGAQHPLSRINIAKVFHNVAAQGTSDDTFVAFFIGRVARGGERVYLCPPEFVADQPVQTGIDLGETAEELALCKCRNKLLLLDLCLFNDGTTLEAADLRDRILHELAYVEGLTVVGHLAERTATVTAPGRNLGMLADAVAAGVRGQAELDGDGYVTADELYAHLQAAIPSAARAGAFVAPPAPWRVVGPGPTGTLVLTAPTKSIDEKDEVAKRDTGAEPQPAKKTADSPVKIVNSLGMEFVRFAPGKYSVGSRPDLWFHRDDEELRTIEETHPYFFGCHEITQGQYAAVMGARPSHHSQTAGYDDRYPVEQVSWNDAVEFCRRLSELPAEKAAGRSLYNLPTECQWERACAASTNELPFHTGLTLTSQQANIRGDRPFGESPASEFLNRTQPIGSYAANRFDICDLHGNVAEWCRDNYVADRFSGLDDKLVEINFLYRDAGTMMTVRGGDFLSDVTYCRAAARRAFDAGYRYKSIGFRVMLYTDE